MTKGEITRAKMIDSASALFQESGYAATGIKEILAHSGAPRGSLYFHFPDGKEQLAEAVVKQYVQGYASALQQIIAAYDTPAQILFGVIDAMAAHIQSNICAAGCPVATIALEMSAKSERLRQASQQGFKHWINILLPIFEQAGLAPESAQSRARSFLSAIEGALILSRAWQSNAPLMDLKSLIPLLLKE